MIDCIYQHYGNVFSLCRSKSSLQSYRASPYHQNEYLLSHRVRFSARLLSIFPQEALREITGFFFHDDNSLTLYEYRQVGKNIKTLPYMSRGIYKACWGRNKGDAYMIFDIFVGNTLYISTADEKKSTPGDLEVLRIRITEVDEAAWRDILGSELNGSANDNQLTAAQWYRINSKIQISRCPIEPEVQLALLQVQDKVQENLRHKNAVGTWIRLYSLYRELALSKLKEDSQEDDQLSFGKLNRAELESGLDAADIRLTFSQLDVIWSALNPSWIDPQLEGLPNVNDEDRVRNNLPPGFHFTDYMTTALGEMNETRRRCVRRTYLHMDVNKRGELEKSLLARFYRKPSLPEGCAKIRVPLTPEEFFRMLEFTASKMCVTFMEFQIIYDGISAAFKEDSDFIYFLKNSWSV